MSGWEKAATTPAPTSTTMKQNTRIKFSVFAIFTPFEFTTGAGICPNHTKKTNALGKYFR
jgi:hypothetical protein